MLRVRRIPGLCAHSRVKPPLRGLALALWVALMLSGCVPELDQPLSDPASASPDSRLLGTWIGSTPDGEGPVWIHFTRSGSSLTDIVLICPEPGKGAEASFYRMHPTAAPGSDFMNVKAYTPRNALSLKVDEEEKYPRPGGYRLAKYHISPEGTLRIWILTDAIARHIEEGQLRGQVRKDGFAKEVKITESPEKFIAFLSKTDHEGIFEPFLACRRVDVKPPGPGAFR